MRLSALALPMGFVLLACSNSTTSEPVNPGVSTAAPTATTPAPSTPGASASGPTSTPPAMQRSIGTAYMRPDGTIVLQMRAEGGGVVGDAAQVYPPNDPKYQDTLKHLNGLKPGESKPVPPWE